MNQWADFEENYLSTKNGELFYRHRPSDGNGIVFLHGIGADSRTWKRLVEFLPRNLDIYMPDLLGHGMSDKPEIDYDVNLQVDAIEELISKLEVDDPILFGHSYGSWVSVLYSLRKEVGALILEDSAGLEDMLTGFGESELESHKEEIFKATTMSGADPRVMRSMLDNIGKDTLTEAILSKVPYRTLIIWGSNDRVVDLALGKRMNELMRGSQLLVIDGGDHQPHFSKPDLVGAALAKFTRSF
jgi:pimeloyl-ACP methyl ester carboxylesterase